MNNFFKFLTELIAGILIAASPSIVGLILGSVVYFGLDTKLGHVLGVILMALGLIIGIFWALKVARTTGTVNFMSRVMATPELDKKTEVEN